jgi:hypothetical protein
MDSRGAVEKRVNTKLPYLDERQERVFLASEAESFGGGMR